MAQHVLRNERGTTLIQVLGAVVILTMIILSFVGISQYTTASNRDTDKRDEALFIAEEIVNNLRAGNTAGYAMDGSTAAVPSQPGFKHRIETNSLADDPINVATIQGRFQVTLQAVITLSEGLKLYSVTVLWGS